MKIIQINDQTFGICVNCGKKFEINPAVLGYIQNNDIPIDYCDDCWEKKKKEQEDREFQNRLPEIIAEAEIPRGYITDRETGEKMTVPPMKFVFEWIWANRERNILLTGNTGTGKSTSACFALERLIEETRRAKRYRYAKLRKLLSEWRDAKTADNTRFADEAFFNRIGELDILVLDEVIDKAKTTESGQEMMFELLDRIADGELKTKLWLLGNFRQGSIIALFGDEAPVRRRIEENFICAGIAKNKVEVFHVWNWNRQKR